MANVKISELTAISAGSDLANADILAIVDDSDTTTKKVALSVLEDFWQGINFCAPTGDSSTEIRLGGTVIFSGTSNQINVTESSGTITIGLPSTITELTTVCATNFAGTLATAAQTNVTSLGTLTALTVDSICLNGTTIGHTSDTDLITLADGAVTIAGDLTISGDDLVMGTNTSGYLLVADGTNYNPVAMSGDIAIDSSGATTIQATSVDNSMLAGSIANAKLSNSSVSYGGISLSLGGTDATPAFNLCDATAYKGDSALVITGALNSGSITSGFGNIDNGSSTLDTGAATVSSLSVSDGNITNVGNIALDTISSDAGTTIGVTLGTDAGDDFTVGSTLLVVKGETGYVGIGTTAPAMDFVVEAGAAGQVALNQYINSNGSYVFNFQKSRGTVGTPLVVADGDYIGTISFLGMDGTSGTFRKAAEIHARVDGTPGSSDMPGRLEFYTTPDGSATTVERMRIDNAGNVGIGTTAPGNFLDIITGTGTNSSGFHLGEVADEGGYLTSIIDHQLTIGGGTEWVAGSEVARSTCASSIAFWAGDIDFYADTGLTDGNIFSGTQRMTIQNDGTVGIGTATPAHKLDVVGTAGLSTGTAWTNTSDIRIKTNVATITGALDKIKQLRPISFKYTDQYLSVHPEIDGSKTYNSFIADEYENVFPDAVSAEGDLVQIIDEETNEKEILLEKLKQYTPTDLPMYFVAAMQEIATRLEALES